MNAQERKYIAKRISDVEAATIAELKNRPLQKPGDALEEAVRSLSYQQILDSILAAIPNSRKALAGVIDVSAGGYDYRAQSYETCKVSVKIQIFETDTTLPNGFNFNEANRLYKAEQKRRDALAAKISATAERCRDKAMLGDGTTALAAFDEFSKTLRALLDE